MSAAKGYRVMGAQTWNDVKEDVGAACVGGAVVLLAAFAAYLIW